MKKDLTFIGMNFNTKKTFYILFIYIALIVLLLFADVFFNIGVSWYGFLIGSGFALAIVFSSKLAKYRSLKEDMPYEIIWWVLPFSIIGARAYYVIFSGVTFFWDAFKIWEGGLAIYGGVLGGAIGGIIYCLIKKQKILATADVVAPVLILGQAIGRWGNFINQEVYGFEITNPILQWFPFGVFIQSEGAWHLATFFYESVFNLIGFVVLALLLKKIKTSGFIGCLYLVYYGIVRFFLEGLRIPKYILFVPNTNFPVSQLVSLIIIAVGIFGALAIYLFQKRKNFQESTKKSNLP